MIKEKLSLLIYTNETFLPIADLCTKEYSKYFEGVKIKKYLVSNKFLDDDEFTYGGFTKIESNVPLENEGRHFGKILIEGLSKIDTEYVLFTLDDLFIINQVKENNLNKVIEFMSGENVDHLSLMSYGHDWEVMDINYEKYDLPNNYIFNFNMSYTHMITLQPMIWKTSSFLEFLNYNKNISLKEFDISNVRNKKGQTRVGPDSNGYFQTNDDFWDYGFKHCCFKRYYENTPYPFDDRPLDGDYFLFLWSEVIAGGKFNLNRGSNCKIFLTNYLEKNNISQSDETFKKFF